jgi:hypothetical protein
MHLRTASLCVALNVLPQAGGLYQQGNIEMAVMTGYLNARAEREAEEAKNAQKQRGGR